MKLLNQSLKYLSFSILLIITIWSAVFYLNMLNEIKSSIDEGLENYKRLIIINAKKDTTILSKQFFDQSFFTIKNISEQKALHFKDEYKDTIINMQDADDEAPEPEPVRLLTTAFKIDQQYYELRVANSMVEEDDLVQELFWDALWLYAILILGVLLIHNFSLKKLWHPFYQLLGLLKDYKLGKDKNLPTVQTNTTEFKDLQHSIHTLLKHGNASFEQQKHFIANASHELQTPLAITINKLELVLENNLQEQYHPEQIAEVLQMLQRLVTLNKSLLLLSKIENKQIFDNQHISINRLTQQLTEEYKELLELKSLEVTTEYKDELTVFMDPSLAHIVVTNLFKNAIFHTTEKDCITILITKNSFKISNTATHGSLPKDQLFNRFHKINPTKEGNGLGLAIVKAITDLYQYHVTYTFENGKHSFLVQFNPAEL